jgi:hypothetical protein
MAAVILLGTCSNYNLSFRDFFDDPSFVAGWLDDGQSGDGNGQYGNEPPPDAWTLTEGSGSSRFTALAVDGLGDVYAAGYQWGTGSYDYGDGKIVQGPSSDANAVLVKYPYD